LRVVRDGKIEWVHTENMVLGDYIVIDRNKNQEWFPNTNNIKEDEGYLFGCLVGDGGYTVRGHITLTSIDRQIVDTCSETTKRLWGKPFRQQGVFKENLLCGVAIWDELFQKYGFNSSVCGEKD